MTIHVTLPEVLRADEPSVPARVVALSEERTAIFFDLCASALSPGARLTALCDGAPFGAPLVVTQLARQDGGKRHVLLVTRPASEVCGSSIAIEAMGAVFGRIDPMALQSPLVDPLAMIAGLSETGRLRLLKLLLTTGASLFGKGELGGFGKLVSQLIESLSAPLPLAAWCPIGRGAGVLSWRLPAEAEVPGPRHLCILHGGRARRFTRFDVVEEAAENTRILHLFVAEQVPEGAELIVLGEQPVRLCGPSADAARSFTGWLGRRSPEVRAKALAWLDTMAAGDAQVAALRDELASPVEAEPKLDVLHLSETPTGLLYLISVDDPRGLLTEMRMEVAGETMIVGCDRLEWHLAAGHVAAGFAPLPRRSGGSAKIVPVYRSGRLGETVEARPAAFDGRVPEAFRGLPMAEAAPILARAVPAGMRSRPVWRRRVITFGTLPAAPRLSLLISAGEAPEHLHTVLAKLTLEPAWRRVEVVVFHGDGPATEMVRQTVEALSLVHRIGIRLVSVAGEAFESERLRAALVETRAAVVLTLGPGCVPEGARWLSRWHRRVARNSAPTVVHASADGSNGSLASAFAAAALNRSAVARLISTRPLLPEVASDFAATPGLIVSPARRLSVAAYETAEPSRLEREAARIAVDEAREAENV